MVPARSVLYLPANRPSAIVKARGLPADAVILDLEDAVQPDAKAEARAAALAAARDGGWAGKTLLLRVNAVGTPWHADDVAAARAGGFAGMVVPKIGSPGEAAGVAGCGLAVWAMVETPAAVLDAAAIAATPGVAALIAGFADLAKDLRCRPGRDRLPLLAAMSALVLAARAADIPVYDGVFTDIHDTQGFAAEAAQARDFGFDGKTLIHPSQVEACNAAFSPTPDEVAEATGLIAAFEAALASGRGVATYRGRMVEHLHVAVARELVARAALTP